MPPSFPSLKRNEQRGSKPRCHLLTHGSKQQVAARLTALAAPYAYVAPTDHWMPEGFHNPEEAQLHQAQRLLPEYMRSELRYWWLVYISNTPNWDIVSTCTIEGVPGILLVEAKAHAQELMKETAGKKLDPAASANSKKNHGQIGWAIEDANLGLAAETSLPWHLSIDHHYQMSNRFAWAWKLADIGCPVVLVYLGFIGAQDMTEGSPLVNVAHWTQLVKDHSKPLVPEKVWNKRREIKYRPFIPLISNPQPSTHQRANRMSTDTTEKGIETLIIRHMTSGDGLRYHQPATSRVTRQGTRANRDGPQQLKNIFPFFPTS